MERERLHQSANRRLTRPDKKSLGVSKMINDVYYLIIEGLRIDIGEFGKHVRDVGLGRQKSFLVFIILS
jgi:hypothetical protein